MIHLILGGQRSGKSGYAESLAKKSLLPVVYLATARALDNEMQARVRRHQRRRPKQWRLIEEPLCLSRALEPYGQGHCVVIDCLNLWLCNFLDSQASRFDERYHHEKQSFLEMLSGLESDALIVTVESGMGLIPGSPASRHFLDALGELNQAVAALARRVTLVVAGCPMQIKGP